MSVSDKPRIITGVEVVRPGVIHLQWSDATQVDLDLSVVLDDPAFAPLRDPLEFAKVCVGEWGHSLTWPSGPELGADTLWREIVSPSGWGRRTESDLDRRARS
jgi:hypothetical protein